MLPVDYHIHSHHSDGEPLDAMVEAASDIGLPAIGFADHCNVTDESRREDARYTLDATVEERHAEIEELEETHGLRIFEGVEMDYYPDDEETIRNALAEIDLDFSLGSIHYVDGTHLQREPHFGSLTADEQAAAVETYYDQLCMLVESELFDVVAHPDLPERNRHLRGIASEEQFRRVADALANSRSIPEINYGRVTAQYGKAHPNPEFVEIIEAHGGEFIAGSDAHTPGGLRGVHEYIAENVDRCFGTLPGLEP